MKYEMIIFVFFSGITGPVILYINDLVFGNVHDRRFTTCFLKKMIVKPTSFLRKIMPFKEIEGAVKPKFLYIRAIPLFIQTIFSFIAILLFLIDQLFIDYMIDEIFAYIGFVSLCIYTIYTLILIVLARCFRL